MISYCIPYYMDNTLVGVVGMDVRYSRLEDAAGSKDSNFDGYTTIVSEQGTVLVHPELEVSDNASRMGEDLRHTGELIAETTGKSGTVLDTFDKTKRVVGYARLDNESILTLVADSTLGTANVDSSLYRMIIVSVVIALLLLAVLWGMLMGFVHPFDKLTDAVLAAGEKRDAQRLPKFSGDATIVSEYVNKLVDENQQLSEELNQTVYTDHLTKCLNAIAWQARLAELTKKAQDNLVLAVFAVDGLQMANVTFDRSKGDYLIITTASRLQAVFGAKQVYRVTGSQFAVVLEEETMQSMLLKTGQFNRLCEQQNAQMAEDWHRVTSTVVVKGFEADKDKSAVDVYKRADYELAEKMGGLEK